MKRALAFLLLCVWIGVAPAVAREPLPATGSIEIAFTPGDDAEGAILKALASARKSIHVQAYLFTSQVLAHALIDARQRGVIVEVLADREMTQKVESSRIPLLAESGIGVWLEGRYASAHNKIIVIDPQEASATVITGSYNFTYSAQARNAENLLILRGNPRVTEAYFDNWRRHRSEAQPYLPPSTE